MFLDFAIKAFQLMNHVEPDNVTHIGSYPEEEPIVHLYEITAGSEVKFWTVQVNHGSLVSAEIKGEEEIANIKAMKAQSSQLESIQEL